MGGSRRIRRSPVALYVSELDAVAANKELRATGLRMWRHWPGAGARAMVWIVRASRGSMLRRVQWSERVGFIEFGGMSVEQDPWRIAAVGVHGAHSETFVCDLEEAGALLKSRSPGAAWVALGDWNTDLLPTMLEDWHGAEVSAEGQERRVWIEAWAEAH